DAMAILFYRQVHCPHQMRDTVVHCFLQHGRLVEPGALEDIMATPQPLVIAQALLVEMPLDDVFVTKELVDRFIDARATVTTKAAYQPVEHEIRVIRGPNGGCETSGCIDDFVSLFRDRYRRISALLRRRSELNGIVPISRAEEGSPVYVVGMVSELITSRRGNKLARVEDDSGDVLVLLNDKSPNLVRDEVVGVSGRVLPRSRETKLIASDYIVRPQLEMREPNRSAVSVEAVLLSDLHVGSANFLTDEWDALVEFLNGRGPYGHAAQRIGYLLLAGDLVDGIGVYPGQIDDLAVKDIYEQYRLLARLLSGVPPTVKVVVQCGNHDIVRGTEPQPMLPEDIRALFADNTMFVPNPVWLDIHGVTVLMYHGRGIDDLVTACPGVTYHNPLDAMRLMLDMRHLAPVYGGKTPIAPGPVDHLVLDPVPDVFLTGHVHSWGVDNYRGTIIVNGSTWQSQTDYQRLMNFSPMPARATVLDLSTLKPRLLNFMGVCG
ncbi:MAG: DNA-directed DNA polymerase II small subunit, partial [Thermoplasmata archaeon]|nr:DNA-directed DNA polymerase II small subunit [Thermoplasmata archaeon]